MGAKVLQVESTPRSLLSEAALLDQLAGDGRLILTASTANQPAWENPKIGHGLLTNFLLEALQGAEEVRKAGKVSVYRLLDYVTSRVVDAANQFWRAAGTDAPRNTRRRAQLAGVRGRSAST